MPARTKPKSKGDRQQAVRRARVAAAAAAERRHDRRRWWIAVVAIGVLVLAVVCGAFVSNKGGSSKASSASPSGQQCVAMADTPPAGAPYVPVHVGPAPTQLVSEELRGGTGTAAVQPGDTVTVNYIGVNCRDGKIFDDTYSNGQPASGVSLGDTIPGWQQGIPGMKVGEQRLLGIPPDLAYGAAGRPGIEANATLWFVVELVSIDGHGSTTTAPGESVPAEPTTAPPPVSS
jgi:peptidylprolyl isomerase